MCLAFPARILRIKGESALVDFGGSRRDIKITLTPKVKRGDWVLIHAGFSIQKLKKGVEEYEILFEREKNG